jgi:hypothetical protein
MRSKNLEVKTIANSRKNHNGNQTAKHNKRDNKEDPGWSTLPKVCLLWWYELYRSPVPFNSDPK